MGNAWIGLSIGLPLLSYLSAKAWRLVNRNALFYGVPNILVVGITLGVVDAAIVHVLTGMDASRVWPLAVLFSWGLVSALHIGFRPDPSDIHRKTGQTAIIATAAYVLSSAGLFFA